MDASLFENFDYVALGHLHRAHYVLDPKIRYSGTFMKYSFDEENLTKTVSLVDLEDVAQIRKIEIPFLRDFVTKRGMFDEILKEERSEDYIKFILEDSYIQENAMARLKEKFPRAVSITYSNKAVFERDDSLDVDIEDKNLLELFAEFYHFKMDEDLSQEEIQLIQRIGLCDQED